MKSKRCGCRGVDCRHGDESAVCSICGNVEPINGDEETSCETTANYRRLQSIYGEDLKGYNGAW